jgi:hypothetical protein
LSLALGHKNDFGIGTTVLVVRRQWMILRLLFLLGLTLDRKEISIDPISTTIQPADFLTKALNQDLLQQHRKTVMGR